MYFLSDASTAKFAKQKKQEEKPATLREKIIGRTNAGKAFRVGALASAAGLGALALKNKNMGKIFSNPLDYYTEKVPKTEPKVMKWRKRASKDLYDEQNNLRAKAGDYIDDYYTERTSDQKVPSFLNSGRNVKWGRVGNTALTAGGVLAVPTTLAYVAGSKKEKEDIRNRVDKTWGQGRKTANDIRTWINTLHRVSR